MEYCAPIFSQLCKTRYVQLKVIQNNCSRIILNKSFDESTESETTLSDIPIIYVRHKELS
jgi:hypothetical protein